MARQSPGNWLSHALREAPWRKQTQATSVVALAIVVVLVIGALYLAQATATATAGRDLQTLEQQRAVLVQENAQIEAEIAQLRSVTRLTNRALELGYRPARNDEIEYLPVEGLPPFEPADIESGPPEVLVYDESFSGWLGQQWNTIVTEFRNFIQQGDAGQITP